MLVSGQHYPIEIIDLFFKRDLSNMAASRLQHEHKTTDNTKVHRIYRATFTYLETLTSTNSICISRPVNKPHLLGKNCIVFEVVERQCTVLPTAVTHGQSMSLCPSNISTKQESFFHSRGYCKRPNIPASTWKCGHAHIPKNLSDDAE